MNGISTSRTFLYAKPANEFLEYLIAWTSLGLPDAVFFCHYSGL